MSFTGSLIIPYEPSVNLSNQEHMAANLHLLFDFALAVEETPSIA